MSLFYINAYMQLSSISVLTISNFVFFHNLFFYFVNSREYWL